MIREVANLFYYKMLMLCYKFAKQEVEVEKSKFREIENVIFIDDEFITGGAMVTII